MVTRTLLVGAAAASAAATLAATPVAAGPCADPDVLCWNVEAVRLVNEVRARLAGLSPLAVGTVAALDNAVAYSRFLVTGPFQHQDRGAATRTIGCNTFVSGENLAKGSPHQDDPAATCVKQWEGSQGHRDNILSTYHKETVVGIVSTAGGYWCTQTFQVNGEGRTGARCQPASGGGGGAAPAAVVSPAGAPSIEQPPPVPEPPRIEEPVVQPPLQGPPQGEAPAPEAPTPQPPRTEAPTPEPPMPEVPRMETPTPEPPVPEATPRQPPSTQLPGGGYTQPCGGRHGSGRHCGGHHRGGSHRGGHRRGGHHGGWRHGGGRHGGRY
eukprot:TRINITY_DN4078_c0_g1_i1.p2 TRINITY_DN4078_c0_g1~~TRINITY_DN4078_c0_g1_i1.p2  ORF type:complete len:325 (-),score=75.58 TRINITY_DN4078_c0_g1_i1:446-1420(-)